MNNPADPTWIDLKRRAREAEAERDAAVTERDTLRYGMEKLVGDWHGCPKVDQIARAALAAGDTGPSEPGADPTVCPACGNTKTWRVAAEAVPSQEAL